MRKLVFLLILIDNLALASCLRPTLSGSGKIISKKQEFSDFKRLEVGNAFQVQLTQADAYKIVVHIDDNLVDHLRLSQRGDTLKIRMKSGRNYSVGDDSMRVEISLPELAGLDLSGASRAVIQGFESSNDLEIEASGASSVFGDLVAGNISLDLSGASSVCLKGSARKMRLHASGASDVELSDFVVTDGVADLSGASEALVNVTGRLDVDASGASDLAYLGNPTLGSVDTSGVSSIRKK